MHPKVDYPGELTPIIQRLCEPLHNVSRRDHNRAARQNEVSLERGYRLEVSGFSNEPRLEVLLDDLRRFLGVVMEVSETHEGYPFRIRMDPVVGAPKEGHESHRLAISDKECLLVAPSLAGLRLAVFRIEDEMLIRRAPILPLGCTTRWTRLKTRITRSPIAPYRWLSGWELEHDRDYYPDEYLSRLAHSGVNGLWVPGLLRNLVASKVIPELGPKAHALFRLNHLIDKAANHGIRIYFFCIEPRGLPRGHPAVAAHPEIVGAHHSICTSDPLVLEYIREVMETLFLEVPGLAGVINIFCGERFTTCWANESHVQDCPRCRERSRAEVLSQTLNAFMEGIRRGSPTAEFMAWAYMVANATESLPIAPMLEVIEHTNPEVIWLGNFEHGSTKTICGREIEVHEYSLSSIGPTKNFTDLAAAVGSRHGRIYAKLQIGNSYEMSSEPYIPVPGIVYDKLTITENLGVTGSMLSWIIGGSPSPMLRAVGECIFEPRQTKDEMLLRLAGIEWGEQVAGQVVRAWEKFAEAWQQYPFHNAVLYWSPLTRAPAYHLRLEHELRLAEPYNWGLNRKRETQPFEDQYRRWLGHYSLEEITSSLRAMAQTWQEGLESMRDAWRISGAYPELARQLAVAEAIRLQLLATANVYEFYALRDSLREHADPKPSVVLARMIQVASDDLEISKSMKQIMHDEPLIGFQSEIFSYSFSEPLIDAKIHQLSDLLVTLRQWKVSGIEYDILEQTVDEVECDRPDYNPDRWGD